MKMYFIVCGGTGGHLAPGIALAQEIIERGDKCYLFVSDKEVDDKLVNNYKDIDYYKLPAVAFSWNPFKWCNFLKKQIESYIKAKLLIKEKKCDVVVGFGGFSNVGVIIAGFISKKICALHEANRKAGKAIKILSFFADRVYLPRWVKLKFCNEKKIRYYGYPIRKDFKTLSKLEARQKLKIDKKNKLLLVLGGSQGAKILNQWVIENCDRLIKNCINVVCITGIGKGSARTIEQKSKNGDTISVRFIPFAKNIAEWVCCADLVVARAGAGTIAELSHCATPSILVPYPFAANNHQHENASFFEQQGGCILVAEKKIKTDLHLEVNDFLKNEKILDKFKSNLRKLQRNDVEQKIVDDLDGLVEAKLTSNCKKAKNFT